jgi:hypothetical protein
MQDSNDKDTSTDTVQSAREYNPDWGQSVFSKSSRPALGAHPAFCSVGNGIIPGGKKAGAWVKHSPPSMNSSCGHGNLYL